MVDTNKAYEKLTRLLIRDIKKGTAPWLQPWDNAKASKARPKGWVNFWPRNAVTDRPYGGGNVLATWGHMNALGFEWGKEEPLFVTAKQAAKLGGRVPLKAEPCFIVAYSKRPFVTEDAAGNEVTRMRGSATGHYVYHVSQCRGELRLKKRTYDTITGLDEDKLWKKFVDAVGCKIWHGGTRAEYDSMIDQINMPTAKSFRTKNLYKSVMLHEMGHWTGHRTRLNRELWHPHGSPMYAKEELIAEMCAGFGGVRMGIPRRDFISSEYVGMWLKSLENDHKWIMRVAGDAGRACDYIFNRALGPT